MITSLGIDKFWDHINEIERNLDQSTSFPPYNIIRHDEENATIEFAVAGYKKNDIEITVFPHPQNYKVLEVSSDRESSDEETMFEHRGIARRKFRSRLPLTEDWNVTGAYCEDGILFVNLHKIIPEGKKPQVVEIA
jgi:molecular chaperone IbpA|tara:strand:- start:132 stop:539 length:408 start_codon:yes stop_codon:yes gene_type:complete